MNPGSGFVRAAPCAAIWHGPCERLAGAGEPGWGQLEPPRPPSAGPASALRLARGVGHLFLGILREFFFR